MGKSTKDLAAFEVGEEVADFVGPLGQPSELLKEDLEELKKKNIVFIAGGVGAAPVYPQVKWLNEQGIKADVILGSRSQELLIFEEELRNVAGNLYVATDDGTYGFKGTGSDVLKDLVNNQGKKYDQAIIIGPMIMMKFTSMLTKEFEIQTTVSLNPIMVDGTGMCGACRVTVGGQVKFACVDGPEFDGHLVNFDEAMRRQTMYKTEEGRKELKQIEGDTHHGGCGQCHEEE
jgi:ferredoxin--NADP+ reductase